MQSRSALPEAELPLAAQSGAVQREVLITGVLGFVGRHLARGLTQRGYRVSGLDLREEEAGPWVEFARCDLSDDASVAEVRFSSRFDFIIHLAGLLPRGSSRARLFSVNTGATSAVLHHFAHPACHVVLFSTALVYGDRPGPFVEDMECFPADAYAQSKWAAEGLVRQWSSEHGARATILRPSVLYGPGVPEDMLVGSLLRDLRLGKPVPLTRGEQLRDFLYVDDVVRAVELVLEHGACGTFNLAAGQSYRVREVAEIAGRIAGRSELLRLGLLPYRAAEVFDYRLDSTALRSVVDFAPRHSLESGLTAAYEALS